MSRTLATTSAPGALAPLTPPAMTPWLRDALKDRLHPHPDVRPEPPKPGVAAEARLVAARLEQALRPATQDEWARWLKPLVPAVRNPPSQAEFPSRVAAIAFAMGDVPAAALTTDALRDVMRASDWWPTPAALLPILQPRYADRMAEMLALRRLGAEQASAQPVAPDLSLEQRAAIAADVRAKLNEITGASPDAKPTVRAAPLRPDALRAARERAGMIRPGGE